jgi:hypothetical protein
MDREQSVCEIQTGSELTILSTMSVLKHFQTHLQAFILFIFVIALAWCLGGFYGFIGILMRCVHISMWPMATARLRRDGPGLQKSLASNLALEVCNSNHD